MNEKWDVLRKMIEDSIIAIHENAIDPDNEFNKIIEGTFGRVLNMMDELEEDREDKAIKELTLEDAYEMMDEYDVICDADSKEIRLEHNGGLDGEDN